MNMTPPMVGVPIFDHVTFRAFHADHFADLEMAQERGLTGRPR